jgi:hypothetical protein
MMKAVMGAHAFDVAAILEKYPIKNNTVNSIDKVI